MHLRYIGHKKDFTLYPPKVPEVIKFAPDNIAEVDDSVGEDLIKENPRTFEAAEFIVPEKLTKKWLSSLAGNKVLDIIEDIAKDRFGVDLDKRHGKAKLIDEILALQKDADPKDTEPAAE
jgi:hypothetical protein